jgi:Methyltransferase domain
VARTGVTRLRGYGYTGYKALRAMNNFRRGFVAGKKFRGVPHRYEQPRAGWLEQYFDAHTEGHGIWKWRHYFDIYERHLAKYRDQDAHILEIGVFSGGSLQMWRDYLGERAHIYGVDIQPECLAYERPGTQIFIGDQADRSFWRQFIGRVPQLDVVIDDGGHETAQQIATLEMILPHLRPGGVYLCEDISGQLDPFLGYVNGLSRGLYTANITGDLAAEPTGLQRWIDSVHLYPFVVVIEKRAAPLTDLSAPQHGDSWQPWLPRIASEDKTATG